MSQWDSVHWENEGGEVHSSVALCTYTKKYEKYSKKIKYTNIQSILYADLMSL